MTVVHLQAILGPLLCIIGAMITWFNTINGSGRKTSFVAGIILVIAGIVLTEIAMHTIQDT